MASGGSGSKQIRVNTLWRFIHVFLLKIFPGSLAWRSRERSTHHRHGSCVLFLLSYIKRFSGLRGRGRWVTEQRGINPTASLSLRVRLWVRFRWFLLLLLLLFARKQVRGDFCKTGEVNSSHLSGVGGGGSAGALLIETPTQTCACVCIYFGACLWACAARAEMRRARYCERTSVPVYLFPAACCRAFLSPFAVTRDDTLSL